MCNKNPTQLSLERIQKLKPQSYHQYYSNPSLQTDFAYLLFLSNEPYKLKNRGMIIQQLTEPATTSDICLKNEELNARNSKVVYHMY